MKGLAIVVVDPASSSTLSQCSTLELEEAQNELERAQRETVMNDTEEMSNLRRHSACTPMVRRLLELDLSEEDAETALRKTRWYSVEYAMEWHFNRQGASA